MDNDQELSKKIPISSPKSAGMADTLTVYDSINRFYGSDFILDIKTVSVVNGHGVLTPVFNVDKGKITNLGLLQQEEVKNHKQCY